MESLINENPDTQTQSKLQKQVHREHKAKETLTHVATEEAQSTEEPSDAAAEGSRIPNLSESAEGIFVYNLFKIFHHFNTF